MFQHPFSATELRDGGISVALNHANLINESWADDAFGCLVRYLQIHKEPFMCEQLRDFAHIDCGLEQPPHARAWGAIIQSASRKGLIKHAGYANTNNPRSHKTPASKWMGV